MNVQFAVRDDDVYLIEVNPRASRTVPFVAKATGVPIAKIAARLMAGAALSDIEIAPFERKHIAVKESVFPFARFPGVDVILGPEMRSTGEVMGLDQSFDRAFLKSQIAAGTHLPDDGLVFVSVRDHDKQPIIPLVRELIDLGFDIIATRGTAAFLHENGMSVHIVNKVAEGRPHIVDLIKDDRIKLMFNTTSGAQSIADSYEIRRTALIMGVPYYTTMAGARAATKALSTKKKSRLDVAPLQSYAGALS